MSRKRIRLALLSVFALLGAIVAVQAATARSGPCPGYGYCRDCKCPGYGGNGTRCNVRTCGHYFSRHY